MPQFGVFRNKSSTTKRLVPYLLDVQSDLLGTTSTRVVVPLFRAADFGTPIRRLNPTFDIGGIEVVMSTAELAAVSRAVLGERVADLAVHRHEIMAALDLLFFGV